MEIVARHLYKHALSISDKDSASLFVKSACNRFYYHIFLLLNNEMKNCLDGKRLHHGSKAGGQINDSYGKKIVDKLKVFDKNSDINNFNVLLQKLRKCYTSLYKIREKADYDDTIIIIFQEKDVKIEYIDDNKKKCQCTLSEIEKSFSELKIIIQSLAFYRQKAGF